MHSSSGSRAASTKSRRPGKQAIVWFWILGFSAAALVATYVMFVEPPPPHKIVIASGSQNGAYFRYAQEYARGVEERRPDRRGARDGGLGGEPATCSVKTARAWGSRSFKAAWRAPRTDSALMPSAACTTSPCGSSTAVRKALERLSQLAGKRIGVGPAGSGTHAIAMRLLAVNGLIESESAAGNSRAVLVQDNVAAAAKALQKGELDAAFFVASFEADYIQGLLSDRNLRLLNFDQREAYHRRFRFLAPVTVPAGIGRILARTSQVRTSRCWHQRPCWSFARIFTPPWSPWFSRRPLASTPRGTSFPSLASFPPNRIATSR